MSEPIPMENYFALDEGTLLPLPENLIGTDVDPLWWEIGWQLQNLDQLNGVVRRIKALAVQVPERAMAE